MHSLLVALVESAYLSFRASDKTYGLGAALIAIGDVSLRRNPYVNAAREVMGHFSAREGLESLGFVRAGGDALCVLRAGPETRPGREVQVGQRLPLIAPLGPVLVAWSPRSEQEGWLQRGGAPGASRREQSRLLEVVRRRGYAVALEVEERRLIGEVVLQLRDDPRSEGLNGDLRTLIAGLRRTECQMTNGRKASYAVSTITAPVLNRLGEFQLAISIQGFPDRMSRREVRRLGEGLLEACETASANVAGHFGRG